ncbi:MAG: DMP19 family protein [Lachnospiraceae bacterium]|nr:DMP19 family protein [Lachnospiraceae bacterium]
MRDKKTIFIKWIDGKDIAIKQYTGESLCEKLAMEIWNTDREQWLKCMEFIQVACFLIAFDTELTMEGIFTFLENSIGHYAPEIIHAFRMIGDNNDADILEKICQYAPPDIMRSEFLDSDCQEYDITSFDSNHDLKDEIVEIIEDLDKKLYLHTDFDIWELLFKYLDEQIKNL